MKWIESLHTKGEKSNIFSFLWRPATGWRHNVTGKNVAFQINTMTTNACWKDLWTIKVKTHQANEPSSHQSHGDTLLQGLSFYLPTGRTEISRLSIFHGERCSPRGQERRCHSLLTFMGRRWNSVKHKPNSGQAVTAVKQSKVKPNW